MAQSCGDGREFKLREEMDIVKRGGESEFITSVGNSPVCKVGDLNGKAPVNVEPGAVRTATDDPDDDERGDRLGTTTRRTETDTGYVDTTTTRYSEGKPVTRTDQTISPRVKWDDSGKGEYQAGSAQGGSTIWNTRKIEDADAYISEVRAQGGGIEDNPQYSNLRAGLMGYFGQRFKSYTSDDAAWRQLVEDAAEDGVSPLDLLKEGQAGYLGAGGYGSGGSGGGGTSMSYTQANKADVRVLANAVAEEMIGRRISDTEFDRMLKKVRKEEDKSPTVTTRSGKTSRTKEGITDAERQEVLEEVLRENPEWKKYQMDTAALDYTRDFIREQKGKANL